MKLNHPSPLKPLSLIAIFVVSVAWTRPASENTDAPAQNHVNHGLVAPSGMRTWGPSTIATVDGNGSRLVFTKLWTGYTASYLFINAETGATEQIYPTRGGLGAYSVLMTPGNVIYDTMGNHSVALDVAKRRVREVGSFPRGKSQGGYVRAEDGTIYVGIYPSATPSFLQSELRQVCQSRSDITVLSMKKPGRNTSALLCSIKPAGFTAALV